MIASRLVLIAINRPSVKRKSKLKADRVLRHGRRLGRFPPSPKHLRLRHQGCIFYDVPRRRLRRCLRLLGAFYTVMMAAAMDDVTLVSATVMATGKLPCNGPRGRRIAITDVAAAGAAT